MTRTAISIPSDLLSQLDRIVEKDYTTRSSVVQDALRYYIRHYEWMREIEGQRVGTIIVIYDFKKKGLAESIVRLRHDLREVIRSMIPLYVNNNRKNIRLELLIVMGNGKLLVTLTEQIQSLNGVLYVKLTTNKTRQEEKRYKKKR